ncbi:MAG TPA: hypothetical protein DER56_02660 [Thermosipho africanus]|nr:hypothetical protein [Thermosipho africanus]
MNILTFREDNKVIKVELAKWYSESQILDVLNYEGEDGFCSFELLTEKKVIIIRRKNIISIKCG